MITTILRIFMGFNLLAGVYFLVAGGMQGAKGQPPVVVIMFVLWAAAFIGLAWAIWARRGFARLWTFILYGLVALATVMNLFGEFESSQSLIFRYPLIYGFVYVFWLAISIGPVVLMLRKDVKEYLSTE